MSKKISSIDNDFCSIIKNVARLTTRFYEYHFRLSGTSITHGQFLLLMALKCNTNKNIKDMAKSMRMERTTFGRLVLPLLRNRFIEQINEGENRNKLYKLTEWGNVLLDKAFPIWQEAQNEFIKLIDERTSVFAKDILKSYQAICVKISEFLDENNARKRSRKELGKIK